MLIHDSSLKKAHACQVLERENELKLLKAENADLNAKCSALQGQKLILTKLFNQVSEQSYVIQKAVLSPKMIHAEVQVSKIKTINQSICQ